VAETVSREDGDPADAPRITRLSAALDDAIASWVSALPSRPPDPRRTISFSRSMTSKDRSGRTRTTIM